MRRWALAALGLALLLGPGAGPARAGVTRVFAAASLSESLTDIAKLYAQKGGGEIQFNFAASGTLGRQIREGAPADVFFSADEVQMDQLAKAGLLADSTRTDLLSNTLVVVAPLGKALTVTSAADLASPSLAKLAIGDTDLVPVGTYTKAWLALEKAWDKVAPKTVPCASVRAVLAAVESGNVDAGVVYRTDALISRKVRVVWEVPRAQGPAIAYPLALLKSAEAHSDAAAFVAFLKGPEAEGVFRSRGFLPAHPSGPKP